MSLTEVVALCPFMVLAGSSVLVMLVIAFHRDHALTALLTVAGMALSFVSLWPAMAVAPTGITSLLTMDGYSPYFIGLVLAAGLAATLLSYGYLQKKNGLLEEYYLLVLLVTLGGAVVVASRHFASFFLGLELLSVSFYALIAYSRTSMSGTEAAIKYVILSAASDAFLLFGMALVYSGTGALEFGAMAAALGQGSLVLVLPGTALMVVGIGFKLAVVPFHMWTPDVYEGAPAPITGLLATVSKVAVFALLVRYFAVLDLHAAKSPVFVLAAIACASMVVGNALALIQTNVKRILAYSSIAHMGYLLVALVAGGKTSLTAVGFYLFAYTVTTLGAFGVIGVLSEPGRDADRLEDLEGLAWNRPWLAGVFTVMLLSLAGIPLTAGFVGKFYVMAAGIGSTLWLLVITLILTSVIGLYYYLRIVVVMFRSRDLAEEPSAIRPQSWTEGLVLTALTVLLLWVGVCPSQLIDVIENTVTLLR
jgi:NADH-quinone oxidoreductase subunit N